MGDKMGLGLLSNFMFTLLLSITVIALTFLAGVYAGTRWSEKVREIYKSIIG